MARLPRYALPGQPQHVIQRGNNRSAMFAAGADYRCFSDWLRTVCDRHDCHVHAYVLMTNHVHLLMTPHSEKGIGKVMQSVGRRYVRYFNSVYQRTGTLWEGRYRATPVDTERYLLTCYRYVELNPVRAGLVANPGDYRWSSHATNAFGLSDSLVTPHERYQALGTDAPSRQAAYRALFRDNMDESALGEIREATNKGWALGSDRFRAELATLLNRRSQPLPRGGAHRRQEPGDVFNGV